VWGVAVRRYGGFSRAIPQGWGHVGRDWGWRLPRESIANGAQIQTTGVAREVPAARLARRARSWGSGGLLGCFCCPSPRHVSESRSRTCEGAREIRREVGRVGARRYGF